MVLFVWAMARPAAASWREIRTDHFTLVGNGSERELRSVALELERFRVIVQATPGMKNTDPIVPVMVFAVRGEEEFRSIAPPTHSKVAGYFQNVGIRVQLVIRLDTQDSIRTAYHEYHHLLMDRGVPAVPVWLLEGLAEIWEGIRIDGNRIDVGHPDEILRHLALLRPRNRLSLADVVSAGHESKYYVQEAYKARFYAHAAVLTHMLLFEEADGEKHLREYIALLEREVPAAEALVQVWGPVAEIEKKFDAYVQRRAFAHRISTLSGPMAMAATLVLRDLTEAEATAYRGQFLAYARDDRATRVLVEALVEDPRSVVAATGLAAIASEEQALALLERATTDPSANVDAFWLSAVRRTSPGAYSAFLRAGRGTAIVRSEHRTAATEAVEADLEKVIALAPRFAPAYVRLANARAGRDLDGALALVRKAVELEPGRPVYLLRLARLTGRAGDDAESRRLAGEAVRAAIALPRTRPAVEVCRYGVFTGMGSAVLPACDSVLARRPAELPVRMARFYGRATSGDLAGAAEDLRAHLPSMDKLDREAARVWIAELEAGRNPVDADVLRRLEDLENSVIGLTAE